MAKKTTKSKSPSAKTAKTVSLRKGTTVTAPVKRAPRAGATTRKTASSRAEIVVLTRDQIAHRAYQLWQITGNTDESHNWAEAERQLKVELGIA